MTADTSPSDIAPPVPFQVMMRTTAKIGAVDGTGTGENEVALFGLAQELMTDDPALTISVILRLKALTKLFDHPLMKAWAQKLGGEGEAYVSEPVVKAAAKAPLFGIERDLSFDPDDFFDRVLRYSDKKRGSAS